MGLRGQPCFTAKLRRMHCVMAKNETYRQLPTTPKGRTLNIFQVLLQALPLSPT